MINSQTISFMKSFGCKVGIIIRKMTSLLWPNYTSPSSSGCVQTMTRTTTLCVASMIRVIKNQWCKIKQISKAEKLDCTAVAQTKLTAVTKTIKIVILSSFATIPSPICYYLVWCKTLKLLIWYFFWWGGGLLNVVILNIYKFCCN